MKTLKTDINGGFPFELDDLRWIAAGISESLEKAGNVIGDNFIVSGLTLTATPSGGDLDITHTAGKVFFGGEFCDVDVLSSPVTIVSGDVGWFAKDETFDATGNETFEDATTHDTYKNTKVKFFTDSSFPVGDYVPFLTFTDSANRVPALLVAKIVNERIEMNSEIQFKNASAATTASNIAAGGVSELDTSSNFQSIEFTTPVVDLCALDSNSSGHVGSFKVVKFVGTSGATELKVVNEVSTGVGTRYKIKTPTGKDMNVLTGDVCVFWNDGANWLLVAGGRPLDVEVSGGVGFSGSWTNSVGSSISFSKSRDGLVKVSGSADLSSYTSSPSFPNKVIFTLPAGFRPEQPEIFPASNYETGAMLVGRLNIKTDGTVNVYFEGLSAAAVTVGLSGISFYTKQ